MKKVVLLLLVVISCSTAKSQFQEINAGTGFAYYFGDLNVKSAAHSLALFGDFFDMKNFKMSYSLGYRYNFKNRWSLGLNFYHLYLSGYDSDNKVTSNTDGAYYRWIRRLSFHTTVNEGFIDLRYEPFRTSKRWDRARFNVSPYVGLGVGFFQFNPKTFTNSGQEVALQPLGTEGQGIAGYPAPYSLFQLVIPVNLGVRFTPPSRKFSIGINFNYNHTFTDYLDDVSTTYPNKTDLAAAYQTSDPQRYALLMELSDRRLAPDYNTVDIRGKSNHEDFFMTGQVKFSLYFNRKADEFYKCCEF